MAVAQLAAIPVTDAEHALASAVQAISQAAANGARLVVLPECSWPGYLIGPDWRSWWDISAQHRAMETLSRSARRHGVTVVVGMALADDEALRNEAVVFERDGAVRGTASKELLWDFDRHWFTVGEQAAVITTSVGRLGVFVCADGRVPEIARRLALGGAELLVDCTGLPTQDPDPATWSNSQQDFVLPTRAMENGLWLAVANKVGLEREILAYTGRSSIVGPDGRTVAVASPTDPGIVSADVILGPARLPVDRRPELYDVIRTATPPAASLFFTCSRARVAVSNLDRDAAESDLQTLSASTVDLVVWPRGLARFEALSWLTMEAPDRAVLRVEGREVAAWQRTHGNEPPGHRIGPVVDSVAGRIGVMLGADGLVPEVARALALQGAEVIAWMGELPVDVRVACTRAAENRTWLIAGGAAGGARVIDPDGRVRADAGALPRIISSMVDTGSAGFKEVVPGTDVLRNRRPERYGSLV